MRRGSLVGPLLLILIGVVFLLRNIRPDLPLFDLFVTWWPVLLIVWGALRVVEILATYFRGRPLPRAGVAGGEWAVIILVTIFAMSVWGVKRWTRELPGKIRIGGVEVFGEAFDYTEPEVVLQAAAQGRLIVENARGNTRITGTDGTELRVLGRKTVRALDRNAADRASEKAKLKVVRNGDTVQVAHAEDSLEGARVSMDLEITAPRGSSIEFRGKYGDLEVKDIAGEVIVDSDNAGLRVESVGGRVKADLRRSDIVRAMKVKGDVLLKGRGRDVELEDIAGGVAIEGSWSGELILKRIARNVRFESPRTEVRAAAVPGEMRLTLSQLSLTQARGPVEIKAETKDVQLSDIADSITVDLERGDVELRQPRPELGRTEIRTRSGDIELALPAAARFRLRATTDRGEAVNDFDPRLKVDQDDRKGVIEGSLGAGPEIRLETQRGRVIVRRLTPAEASALLGRPPQAPPPPEPPKAVNQ
ncbi:MAG: DUF4097 family beta strand repeat-containing protein [Bryobacteraceae bacterium]|nr:DUF4097 family beta strand repeat-containing protein [Bryobacteraceae bacterium]